MGKFLFLLLLCVGAWYLLRRSPSENPEAASSAVSSPADSAREIKQSAIPPRLVEPPGFALPEQASPFEVLSTSREFLRAHRAFVRDRLQAVAGEIAAGKPVAEVLALGGVLDRATEPARRRKGLVENLERAVAQYRETLAAPTPEPGAEAQARVAWERNLRNLEQVMLQLERDQAASERLKQRRLEWLNYHEIAAAFRDDGFARRSLVQKLQEELPHWTD